MPVSGNINALCKITSGRSPHQPARMTGKTPSWKWRRQLAAASARMMILRRDFGFNQVSLWNLVVWWEKKQKKKKQIHIEGVCVLSGVSFSSHPMHPSPISTAGHPTNPGKKGSCLYAPSSSNIRHANQPGSSPNSHTILHGFSPSASLRYMLQVSRSPPHLTRTRPVGHPRPRRTLECCNPCEGCARISHIPYRKYMYSYLWRCWRS